MPKDVTSYRIHPTLRSLITETAEDLQTSETWVIEAALGDYFRDKLAERAPEFRPGMPHKEPKDKKK
jgi:hypothetical protein